MQVAQITWSPSSNLTACSAAVTTERAVTAPSVISTMARSDVSNSVRNSEPINSLLSGETGRPSRPSIVAIRWERCCSYRSN